MTPKTINAGPGLPPWLEQYRFGLRVAEQGTIVSMGDGIALISGLPSAAMDEMLILPTAAAGWSSRWGGAPERRVTGGGSRADRGRTGVLSGHRLSIPMGDALLGRVVDPLGKPLDGGPRAGMPRRGASEVASPPIIAREFVEARSTPEADRRYADPHRRGQRQLVIGDNGVGKSSLALDTVINQEGKNVLCVYVLIGQKRSDGGQ